MGQAGEKENDEHVGVSFHKRRSRQTEDTPREKVASRREGQP